MQEALKFAQAWDLDGIVLGCEPLVYGPKLIGHTHDQGLVCLSYGGMNNVPEKAKVIAFRLAVCRTAANILQIQVNGGLDAICTDEVGLIIQTLKA